MKRIQRMVAVGAMAAMAAVVGACSSGAQAPAAGSQPGQAPAAPPEHSAEPSAEAPAAPTTTGVTKISDIFGPACSQVPKTGPGSAQGMVDDPVATAASHNPLLTTLTKALTAANLVDSLNGATGLTVFAPADSAFQALDAMHPGTVIQLTTAPNVASPDSKLAKILKYHVVGQRYDAAGLVQAGSVDSLEGAKIKIAGTAVAPTVNGVPVLCGNIPTKNATVFVIGQVLMPPAS